MYGIDFGTSNTVFSHTVGGHSSSLALGDFGTVVPSLLYFERDKPFAAGQDAVREYRQALGRWRNEKKLYAKFRFFQGLKYALRDTSFTGTGIFGKRWRAEDLVGAYLGELKKRADRSTGQTAGEVILGRPVVLSGDPGEDAEIQERFREACLIAGFDRVHFVTEPIAAAVSLLGRYEGLVLVFDFGGGTLDIAIAELSGGTARILSSAGAELGGYTLNEDLSRARIIRHFGFGSTFRTMTGKDLEIPTWITNQVASFYALPLSDITKTKDTIKDLVYEARDKGALLGLSEFLDRNLSFDLFRRIDEAKIELSESDGAVIGFAVHPHITFEEKVLRREFDAIIQNRVAQAGKAVLNALESAAVPATDIGRVIRVGGSSQVPAFMSMLEAMFPGKVDRGEVFTSISNGLIGAWEAGLGSD